MRARLVRVLDQASMEAVAALLAGLPLQLEESDRGDLMEAKSQLFLKLVNQQQTKEVRSGVGD